MIYTRIIEKFIHFNGAFEVGPISGPKALASYLLFPIVTPPLYYRISHNNRFKAMTICQTLVRMGYRVRVQSYLDPEIPKGKDYRIFFGHNVHFAKIARAIGNPECRKILFMTGSHPQFGNDQQMRRMMNLRQRRGFEIPVYGENVVPDLSANYEAADEILMLGTEFIKNTYPENARAKATLIDSIACIKTRSRDYASRNFLFMSSVGQVHRGLDMLLEIFAGRREKLYVCSSYSTEPEFEKHYEKELYHTPNIVGAGYLNTNGSRFAGIAADSGFCVLPSCSEGQSSSVLNAMALGLLPVVTPHCGIPDVDKAGFLIEGETIEAVREAVERAVTASDSVLAEKRRYVLGMMERFTKPAFRKNLSAAFSRKALVHG